MSTSAPAAPATKQVKPCEARPRVLVVEWLRERFRAIAGEIAAGIAAVVGEALPTTGEEFAALERRLAALGTTRLIAPVLESVLVRLHESQEFVEYAIARASEQRPLELHSRRDVSVRVLGGGVVRCRTAYATPPPPPENRPGRRRGVGRRGATGNGCYPVLAQLGFLWRTSPALTSTVARAAAELASYAEARESLAARGIQLDLKTVRLIAHRVADAGLEARAATGEDGETEALKGKRVVVAFDGGRIRTRVSGKCGRRRVATGRRRYDTPWREPALLAIYTVDEKGKKTCERPWYEGTLDGWDHAFEIATALLCRLGARHATELVIAGDGAPTIWDRVQELVSAIGIDPARVHRFVDFWHAVEHLHDVAKLVRHFTPEERARWVRLRRRQLHNGWTDAVVGEIEALAVGRLAKDLAREADYFRKRRSLMRYDTLRARNLPIGTGAVESAIRRVVNLRMKSPGIFWEAPNAERMLLLRCRLKDGRWDELERDVYAMSFATHGRVLQREQRARAAA